jgi:hypothetical protein
VEVACELPCPRVNFVDGGIGGASRCGHAVMLGCSQRDERHGRLSMRNNRRKEAVQLGVLYSLG